MFRVFLTAVALLVGINEAIALKEPFVEDFGTQINHFEHRCDAVIIIQSQESQKLSIPRRLFQTWKTHQLPKQFADWSKTWKIHHPDWEYELWDDDENRTFIQNHFPWFLPHYDAYPREIYRVDAVRYFYLYLYGGIYADLDFECFKSIEPLLDENCVILGRMSHYEHEHQIPNAFMASPPKAEFWLVVIYCLLNAPYSPQPEYMTGPVILREAVLNYQDQKKRQLILDQMKIFFKDAVPTAVQIRPPCELYPLDWTSWKYEICPCNYAITWWAHSWQ